MVRTGSVWSRFHWASGIRRAQRSASSLANFGGYNLDGAWGFMLATPLWLFALLPLVPTRLFPFVEQVFPMSCGIGITLRQHGIKTFVRSAHLPHRQRADCIDTWQAFNSELECFLKPRRFQDTIIVMHDTNYELGATEHCMNPNSSDERGFIAADSQQRYGLVHWPRCLYLEQ